MTLKNKVYIDTNGDAEGNFTVVALQEDQSIQSNLTMKMSMQPVGYFLYNKPGDIPVSFSPLFFSSKLSTFSDGYLHQIGVQIHNR